MVFASFPQPQDTSQTVLPQCKLTCSQIISCSPVAIPELDLVSGVTDQLKMSFYVGVERKFEESDTLTSLRKLRASSHNLRIFSYPQIWKVPDKLSSIFLRELPLYRSIRLPAPHHHQLGALTPTLTLNSIAARTPSLLLLVHSIL